MTIDKFNPNGFETWKFSLRQNSNMAKGETFSEILGMVAKEGNNLLPHIQWLEEKGEDMTIKDFARIFRWLREKEREVKGPQFALYNNLESPIGNTQSPIPNPQYETHVTHRQVLYQLIENVRLYLLKKRKEGIIRIEDKFLGRILVRVKVRSGKVGLKFVVTAQDTKRLIEEDIDMLRKSFIRLGMELCEFEVSLCRDEKGLITEEKTCKLKEEISVFWSNNIIDYVA